MLKLKAFFKSRKNTFIFFTVLFILGVVFGSIFITILDKSDKEVVINQVESFFSDYDSGNYFTVLKNSLLSNLFSITIIWLLGISIIGIPLIILFMFSKGFVLGFSCGSIITVYGLKGLPISIGYMFPHQFINIIAMFILSIISFSLSIDFLKKLLTKRNMDFKVWVGKYLKVLFICFAIGIISSLFETFVSPFILKLVSTLI